MKNMRISLLALALAVVVPVVALVSVCAATPSQYGDTFLGELSEKYDRLRDIKEDKVVLIGGSSLAFGVDSKAMEEQLGMPVVNFGLYATLGTKVMLDLSKSGVRRGDIVVICPEMDNQTLSLYYNAEAMWQACDSDASLLFGIGSDNIGDMMGGFWGYLSDKLGYALGEGLKVEGVYSKAAFNEYGDIEYERPYNQMALGYDPNKMITLSGDIFDADFIEYVNSYVSWAKLRGVTVYFSFPPMNKDAVLTTSDEEMHEFYQFLSDELDCEVISDVGNYILDGGYFYDSNFHLNDAGVPIRTMQLVEDIRRAQGNTDAVEIVYPEIPEVPVIDIGNNGDGEQTDFTETDASMFEFEEFGKGLVITGVKGDALTGETIVVPKKADGKAVLAIKDGAFGKCTKLKTLVIYNNIVQLYDGFLSGCNSIAEIYLYNSDCSSVSIGAELLKGVNSKPSIKVPYEAFGSYVSDYFWGIYSSNLTVISAPEE